MKWENINQLCDVVRETSFAIHKYHRNGHLEKIYENALVNRLRKQGLQVEQQFPLTVYDEDGTVLGEYFDTVPSLQGIGIDLLNVCPYFPVSNCTKEGDHVGTGGIPS